METIKIEIEMLPCNAKIFLEELHEYMDRDGCIYYINSVLDDIEQQILKKGGIKYNESK